MFKCHVTIFLFLTLNLKESFGGFWCKDSALWDLQNCLQFSNCPRLTNDPKFYCTFACAKKSGDCKLQISKNPQVSAAREFYKCLKYNCLDTPSKSLCLKSCANFSAVPTLP